VTRVENGLVLRQVRYKDADRLIELLTAEHGRITVKVRGALRKGSRMTVCTDPPVYAAFTLYESGNGHITADEAEPLELFFGLREDLSRLSLAFYLTEVATELSEEGLSADELLRLTLNSLYALSTLKKTCALVKTAFELRAAAISGWEPTVDACVECGQEPKRPMFGVRDGAVRCADCRTGADGLHLPLSATALDAMRYIVYGDPKKIFSFRLPPDDLKCLSDATEAYLLTQTEHHFRTLDYYKSIL